MTVTLKVGMVGAGISGLAAARSLSRCGIPFECFERGDHIGANLTLNSAPRLRISRERLQYSDWPMPKSYPQFPRKTHLAAYLRDYAERFDLSPRIRLQKEVSSASRTPKGGWDLELGNGEQRRFDALVVATGCNSVPRRPDPIPAGAFSGEQLHSRECVDEAVLRDRDVVVVGAGAAAADLAVASSYVARSTRLSLREPRYVLPQITLGRPYDQLPGLTYLLGKGVGWGRFSLPLPRAARDRAATAGHRMLNSLSLHGLPQPRRPLGEDPATPAPHLLERLLHGRIEIRPEIERLDGELLRFCDGSRARADLIVWCSGDRAEFPFLPAELAPIREGRLELFWNVFHPRVPDLAFVGIAEPATGSPAPVAECQGEWVAAQLQGRYLLPDEGTMWKRIERRRLSRQRHNRLRARPLMVEPFGYERQVGRELRAGRLRAGRQRRRDG